VGEAGVQLTAQRRLVNGYLANGGHSSRYPIQGHINPTPFTCHRGEGVLAIP